MQKLFFMVGTKVCIIEDEQVNITSLMLILKELDYEVTGIAMDYNQAIEMLNSVEPDIVLVDIMLGNEKDGILLGQLIRNKYGKPFIFITSLSDKDTIKKATLTNPDGYLLKPYNKAEIYAAIEVAINNSAKQGNQLPKVSFFDKHIFVKDEYKYVKLEFKSIWYIKAEGNYIKIYTGDKNLMIRSSLNSFIQKLPLSKFIQTQKSYVVNIDMIQSITGNEVIVSGATVPLGKIYKADLLAKLNITQ